MDQTPNLNLPIPNADAVPPTNISGEFPRIALALTMLDAIIFALQGVVANKANADHSQGISTITGLVDALASKMPANATFSLDDLQDVQGAAEAAVNYVLVKNAEGRWVPSSALAAIGEHEHSMAQVVGLTEALVDIDEAMAIFATAIDGRIRFLASGAALPASNVGPIWHADYASIMTWQTFAANGAAFTGYASIQIGAPRLDGQSTPRAGWLKRNGASYSKTTYAGLWNWALHNGRVVSLGSWAAGAFVFADNGDGTFKLPDSRAEFERNWDDGRGIDSARAFGSSQLDQMQRITGDIGAGRWTTGYESGAFTSLGSSYPSRMADGTNTGNVIRLDTGSAASIAAGFRAGTETRGRNLALLGVIKF